MNTHVTDPEAGSVESFLQHEAMPSISTMRTLFKAIKAMTKDSTIAELASHGTYLGDAMHNEIDVMRGDLRDARKASPVA